MVVVVVVCVCLRCLLDEGGGFGRREFGRKE